MTIAAAEPKTKRTPTRKERTPQDVPGVTRPMTYEEYMAGPEETARYDIIDGIKKNRLYGEKQVPSPTRTHQRIQGRLFLPFNAFEERTKAGQVIQPPCDVLIQRTPRLRTRQPDMLFISQERLNENLSPNSTDPLSPAPELVVEIVSPSDKPGVLAAKIADYRSVGVQEVWLVRAEPQTVEVIRLSDEEIETVAVYEIGQTVSSLAFSGLVADVKDIFTQ